MRARRAAAVVAVLLLLALAVAARPAAGRRPSADQGRGQCRRRRAALPGWSSRIAEEVEWQVRLANGIIVITFKRPVDVAVDRISAGAGDYISAARRDPDGKAVRIALARKVTVNSMAAGERLFVDLLPDTWTGLPPGLPREVIEELARRAREAEKQAARQQQSLAQQKARCRRSACGSRSQPTFTRYVFDLPELIGVAADSAKDKLTLTFDGMLQVRSRRRQGDAAADRRVDRQRARSARPRVGALHASSARSTCAPSARTTATSSTSARRAKDGAGRTSGRADELAALAAACRARRPRRPT